MTLTPPLATLLVIDVQRGVVQDAIDVPGVLGRINTLLLRARDLGAPVIFVQHEENDDPQLTRGTPGWEFADGLDYQESDPIVAKTFRDSFANTTLDELLQKFGSTKLIVTGAQSDYCVQTTALSALQHGYDVTLVSDAHTTCATGPHEGSIAGGAVIDFINGHFASLSYPSRSVEVLSAAKVTF
ncbi:MAG: cysteine hydrolase [Acidobacteria bacterium]|nr:cysteine hydrolase [Acidobacteriota bacterium]